MSDRPIQTLILHERGIDGTPSTYRLVDTTHECQHWNAETFYLHHHPSTMGSRLLLKIHEKKKATPRQHIVSTNVMNIPQIGMSTSSVAIATHRFGMSPLILTPLLKSLRLRNLGPRSLRPLPPIKRRNLTDIPANHVLRMSAVSKEAGRRRGGW
jgi:hypothetical protein